MSVSSFVASFESRMASSTSIAIDSYVSASASRLSESGSSEGSPASIRQSCEAMLAARSGTDVRSQSSLASSCDPVSTAHIIRSVQEGAILSSSVERPYSFRAGTLTVYLPIRPGG